MSLSCICKVVNPFLQKKFVYANLLTSGGVSMKGKDSKESVENYLETILILKHKLGQVRSVDIVRAMDF